MNQKLYFAAPLFSNAERAFNEDTAAALSGNFDIFLPQRDGGLLLEIAAKGVSPVQAAQIVFKNDLDAVRAADVILVILDGRAIDEGVAFELGFACALGKRCIGLQTDIRRMLPTGNNPMIDGAIERTFSSVEALTHWARSQNVSGTTHAR